MAAYRQYFEMSDYNGKVYWEFLIANNYTDLFTGIYSDVDIVEFGSVKIEGESLTLEQKEDEFDFEVNEVKIRTAADEACSLLMKQSEYTDVWVALFEHESPDFTTCNFNQMIFSGKVRRKASGQDIYWNGSQWNMNPSPLRSWKYSAQAFGAAVLDQVNLTSKKIDDETTVVGVLDEIGVGLIDLDINPVVAQGQTEKYKGAARFDAVIESIIKRTEQRLQGKIPGLTINIIPSETGFVYTRYAQSYGENDKRRMPLFGNNPLMGLMIDSRLIKPEKGDDGITIEQDYQISWHRFESVTELLYNLAVCFGCVLRFRNISAVNLEISFEPVLGNSGKTLYLIDANSGDVDLQSTFVSAEDMYYCQAMDICNEGISHCRKEDGYLSTEDKISTKGTALPLSVSLTWQSVTDSRWNQYLIHQNCDTDNLETYKAAWTGMLAHFGTGTGWYFDIIEKVATTINGKSYWYNKLSDCLNNRISTNGEVFNIEYKITLPYIKSFSVNADGSQPSLHNLKLFDQTILDSKEYKIVQIEIKPRDGEIDIVLANTSRFGFVEPTSPTSGIIHGKLPAWILEQPAHETVKETSGTVLTNSRLVGYGSDGKLYPYINKDSYGKYAGITIDNTEADSQVYLKIEGKEYTDMTLIPGKPVYARYDSELGHCVPTSARLMIPNSNENVDIRIGRAITEHIFIIERGDEFLI